MCEYVGKPFLLTSCMSDASNSLYKEVILPV